MVVTFPQPPMPADQPAPGGPAAALQQAIMACTANGWRLQTATPTTAVMVSGRNSSGVNHVLHAILSLLTCGLWLLVWLLVVLFARGTREKSLLIIANGDGTVSYQEGT